MNDRGFAVTRQAVERCLAVLPAPCYELRLIDAATRRCRASRWWSAFVLASPGVIAFLRARNRAGCQVYFRPWMRECNAGHVLLDFDSAPCPLEPMRECGHTPSLVVETSPGHGQAWVRIGAGPVPPARATVVARQLALRYGADPASADWRHLGRLAGFTNRKPQRCGPDGLAPWVRIVWAAAHAPVVAVALSESEVSAPRLAAPAPELGDVPVYRDWLRAAGVRPPVTDWSVADFRVARALLHAGYSAGLAMDALRAGSPGFPRHHARPEDYLVRTVSRAGAGLDLASAFPAAPEY
jgi:hypothetical protein